MTEEKWKDIVGKVKDAFKVEEEGKEHLEEMGGIDIEFVVFVGPLGKMKLEFATKPVVLDKKTSYSNRIGSETKVNYIYSDTEKSCHLSAFKWDEATDDWTEIDGSMFA